MKLFRIGVVVCALLFVQQAVFAQFGGLLSPESRFNSANGSMTGEGFIAIQRGGAGSYEVTAGGRAVYNNIYLQSEYFKTAQNRKRFTLAGGYEDANTRAGVILPFNNGKMFSPAVNGDFYHRESNSSVSFRHSNDATVIYGSSGNARRD